MQVNKFFYGLFVCAALCACSNDDVSEIISDDNDTPKVFTGDEAYISVRLSDAGSIQSRANTEDPGYEYGDEHSVANAYFYFYDANGVFVSEGSAWNGGTANEGSPAGNIEFKSSNVVVLKGLTKKNYPKYMVTVLNRPSSFAAPASLKEMEKALSDESGVGIQDGNNKFVMSTTSWAGQTNSESESMKYFVTEVKEANFSLEPIADNLSEIPNPVTVYVERLAAKVTLKVDENLTKETINGNTYYKIKATVAGEGNDADVNESGNQTAAEDLYVKLLGWKLNATAKHSYIVKNIDESWSNETNGSLGFIWNKPSDFRSFWGKSFNYDVSSWNYPTTAAGYDNNKTGYPLDYVNLEGESNDDTKLPQIGSSCYCAENTNTSAIVSANFPSAVTSILLKAEVCDGAGNALDLVRFNGVLFKKTSFIEYILNVMKAKSLWNVWIKTSAKGANTETYEQIGTDKVELVNVSDGEVKVQLTDAAKALDLYSYNNTTKEYEPMTDEGKTSVNTDLATESADAIGYRGGLMYYNIPIEHLNNSAIENGVIPEAKYGVVRNHHYVVTINKLENIGKGIFDPNEEIVPGKDDDKDTYYVGANINILSWKIVSQGVEL